VSGVSGLASVTGPITMPADVRKTGADGEETYRAALGFERQMLQELTKTMAKDLTGTGASDGSGDSGGEGDAATSAYGDMLPGTLADSLTSAGGLGLAHDLWLSMRSAQS
jgi:Rod binding domain-containing protein